MAEVAGAGSPKSEGENPKVTSKFDRDQGKPSSVAHLGKGESASGHMKPTEVGHSAGEFSHRQISPSGTDMAQGVKHGSMLNKSQTDRIEGRKPAPVHDKVIPDGRGWMYGGTRPASDHIQGHDKPSKSTRQGTGYLDKRGNK
jgi:hypothetical protein